jgi:hypothetical protein
MEFEVARSIIVEFCVEVKLSLEGLMAIGCTDLYMDHFTPRVKWFSQNMQQQVWDCVIAL